MTSLARTVVDLARHLAFGPALAIADAALRRGLRPEELAALLADCRRWPGVRATRLVAAHADSRAESPLESLARALCVEFDLPPPQLQVPIGLGHGVVARVDLLWRRQRVVGEADGRAKYDTVGELDRERRREAALVSAGYRVVRIGWPGATGRRAETAACCAGY